MQGKRTEAGAQELHADGVPRLEAVAAMGRTDLDAHAVDAAEHPDPLVRAREQGDLEWWVRQARRTLDAGLW